MHPIYQAGIDMIQAIQTIASGPLDILFITITWMGNEEFYLLLLPLFYWCISMTVGFHLGVLFMVSSYVNVGLKEFFHQPRPFEFVSELARIEMHGYGIPSGHAQGSATLWGFLIWYWRNRTFQILAGALIILIAFSRLYLGVHFPTDILAGWALAAALLALAFALTPWFRRTAEERPGLLLLAGANLIPLALVFIDPTRETAPLLGALIGLFDGFFLFKARYELVIRGGIASRILRYLLGVVLLVLLYGGLKALFPSSGEPFYAAFRFLRYLAVGLWISGGAPFLFELTGINRTRE